MPSGSQNGKSNGPKGRPRAKGNKSQLVEIGQRQALVAQYYTRGMSQVEIVKVLMEKHGIKSSQPTVSNDINATLELWKGEKLDEIEQQKLKEIAALNRAEAVAWEEFEFSQRRKVVIKPKKGDADQREKVIFERTLGSQGWHEQALRCHDRRVRLMGMIREITIKPNGDNVNNSVVNIWSQIVQGGPVDPLEEKLKELRGEVIDGKVDEVDR